MRNTGGSSELEMKMGKLEKDDDRWVMAPAESRRDGDGGGVCGGVNGVSCDGDGWTMSHVNPVSDPSSLRIFRIGFRILPRFCGSDPIHEQPYLLIDGRFRRLLCWQVHQIVQVKPLVSGYHSHED
ncbi:hypothetical protein PIB30_089859 [Stylosanthes scabra]|uniref:Uncharacterized protein n=1 Tax=Stylosanthes scabra TaxID=79078 RepID=A0ABU6TTL3_9FABA|nr:hypothetical protein [Stylosanthes scabra]